MRTDLEMIMDELQKMQACLGRIESKYDAMQASRAGRAEGSQAPSAKAEALAEHEAFWAPIRTRWPAMRKHPSTERAYREHIATFDKEPDPAKIRSLAADLPPGRYWWGDSLAAQIKTSPAKAKGLLFFMKALGVAKWVEGKGCLVTENENRGGVV